MGEGEEGATCQSPIHHGLCLALAATVAPESPPKRFAGKKKQGPPPTVMRFLVPGQVVFIVAR